MGFNDVTLSIPCYNVEDTLKQTLKSVDRLDPSPSSVLCVDDGSTDDTRDIIEAHEGVRLIEHEQNRGLGATLNTALAHAETPLFAKIDADIVVPSDWLAKIRSEKEDNDAAFVQGRFIDQVKTSGDRWRQQYPSPSFGNQPVRNKPLNGSNTLADTDALRDVGGWDEKYRRAFDDIDLMERLIEAGYDIYYSPAVRATHIRTDTWKEVLKTDWAYYNNPRNGGKPDCTHDIFSRLPSHAYRSAKFSFFETYRVRPALIAISLLLLPSHVKWDIDCVRGEIHGY